MDDHVTALRGTVVALLQAKARYGRAARQGLSARRRVYAERQPVKADLFVVVILAYAGGTSGTNFIEAVKAKFVLLFR